MFFPGRLLLTVAIFATFATACSDTGDEGANWGGTDNIPVITGRNPAHRPPVDTTDSGGDTFTQAVDSTFNSDSATLSGNNQDTETDSQMDSTESTAASTGTDSTDGTSTEASSDATPGSDSSPMSPATWTVMVYMAADSDLEPDMMIDLDELRAIVAPDWLHILILFDRHPYLDRSDGDWTGTRLYKVNPRMAEGLERLADPEYLELTNAGDIDELDMADGATLEHFIQYSQQSWPADHYALVLSGHGNGWMKKGAGQTSQLPKVICSDFSDNRDGMSVENVLAPLLKSYQIDVLGFDACLMGMIEVAWAVKDNVKYVIASEANETSDGWDFDKWFTSWIASGDYSLTSFLRRQVLSYRNYYSELSPPWQVTISVVDTGRLPALGDAINALVAQYTVSDFISQAMSMDDDYTEYYDLWNIADLVGDSNLKSAIEAAVIFNWYSDGVDTPGGLSIMFLEQFPDDYRQISFCLDLDWC